MKLRPKQLNEILLNDDKIDAPRPSVVQYVRNFKREMERFTARHTL